MCRLDIPEYHVGKHQLLVLNSLRLFFVVASVISYEGAVLIEMTHELVVLVEIA